MTAEIVAGLLVLSWATFALARWLEQRHEQQQEDMRCGMVRGKFKVAVVTQEGDTATVQLEHVANGDEDADVHGGSVSLVVETGAAEGLFAPGREVVVEVSQAD